jgi:hypothetical protein
VINLLCFFWIRYDAAYHPPLFNKVPEGRILFNVATALISFVIALQYFKFEQMAAEKPFNKKMLN